MPNSHTFRVATMLAIGIVLLGILPVRQRTLAGGKTSPKSPPVQLSKNQRDLKQLQLIFGQDVVTVFVSSQPNMVEGRISGLVDLFDRRYLVVMDQRGKSVLVQVDRINSIRQN
ncbi:MAG: hypothetical protein ACFCD0_17490 [Gemmataceae bacterium]